MRSRKDIITLGGYFAALAGLGLTAATVGPTLPNLAAAAGVSLAQIGFLIFAQSFGGMFGSLLAGRLIDHGGGRSALIVSVLVMAGCLAWVPFFHSLILLSGVFFVIGAAQGTIHTGSNTLLVWTRPEKAHSLLSVLHFSFGAGMVTAPLLVAWFLPLRADGLFIYWVLALALLPVALVLTVSSHPSVPRMEKATQQHSSSRAALFWAIALFFLYVGAEVNMSAWLYTYAVRAASFTPEVSAYLLTTFLGGFMVGRLLSIFMSTLINPTQYVSGGLLSGAVSTVGMVAFSSQGGPYLWMSVAILGLSMAAVFPQAFAFVSKTLGLSGRRTASLLIAGSFGGMLMPWLTGLWLDSVSAQALPIAVGLALGLAFISFQMMKRAAGQKLVDLLS